MDAAIPADAQNAPTAPTPIIVVVNERKNNGDSNSVAKPSTESDQAHIDKREGKLILADLHVAWPLQRTDRLPDASRPV